MSKDLYIAIDEAGNFDFSPNGTKYFVLSCISSSDPYPLMYDLIKLRYELLAQGRNIEYFHASEDRWDIRNMVSDILEHHNNFIVDSVIVEKAKANPAIRELSKFYPMMFGYLLKYVLRRYEKVDYDKLIIFTDRIPVKKKKAEVERAIKKNLKKIIKLGVRYYIYHHEAKSNSFIQAADYCNWAIYIKWTKGELKPIKRIERKVASEFDIFRFGKTRYY